MGFKAATTWSNREQPSSRLLLAVALRHMVANGCIHKRHCVTAALLQFSRSHTVGAVAPKRHEVDCAMQPDPTLAALAGLRAVGRLLELLDVELDGNAVRERNATSTRSVPLSKTQSLMSSGSFSALSLLNDPFLNQPFHPSFEEGCADRVVARG